MRTVPVISRKEHITDFYSWSRRQAYVVTHWEQGFGHMVKRYNDVYKEQIPEDHASPVPANLLQ